MTNIRMQLQRIYAYACLSLAVLVSLATSFPSQTNSLAPGTYLVKSDCPDAEPSGTLEIVTTDDSLDLGQRRMNEGTRFGFPSNNLGPDALPSDKNSGSGMLSSSDTRICKATIWDPASDTGLFSCYEQGELICTIYLELLRN